MVPDCMLSDAFYCGAAISLGQNLSHHGRSEQGPILPLGTAHRQSPGSGHARTSHQDGAHGRLRLLDSGPPGARAACPAARGTTGFRLSALRPDGRERQPDRVGYQRTSFVREGARRGRRPYPMPALFDERFDRRVLLNSRRLEFKIASHQMIGAQDSHLGNITSGIVPGVLSEPLEETRERSSRAAAGQAWRHPRRRLPMSPHGVVKTRPERIRTPPGHPQEPRSGRAVHAAPQCGKCDRFRARVRESVRNGG